MSRIVHPQFRNENESARYPFTDDSTLTAAGRQIAPELFLDAMLYPVGNVAALSLRTITTNGLTITLAFGTRSAVLCSAQVDLIDIPSDGLLAVSDNQGRPAGTLVLSPALLFSLSSWPFGATNIPVGVADLVATCVVPRPDLGVRSLRAEDTAGLAGDVWLVGGDGVVLTFEDGALQLNVVGEPLGLRRVCGESGVFTTPTFVRTINGQPPTEWGGFRINAGAALTPNSALRVYPDGNAIILGLAVGD